MEQGRSGSQNLGSGGPSLSTGPEKQASALWWLLVAQAHSRISEATRERSPNRSLQQPRRASYNQPAIYLKNK